MDFALFRPTTSLKDHFDPRAILVLLVTVATATVGALLAHDTNHPVTAALTFVMTVLVNGSVGGLGYGIVAATCVSFVYTVFIRYPVYRLGLDAIDDVFPVLALTLTAVMSGAVSGKLRDRLMAADLARRQLSRLLAYSNDLQSALRLEEIAQTLFAAVPDSHTREAILHHVRVGLALTRPTKWDQAVAAMRSDGTVPTTPRNQAQVSGDDVLAIAGLTVMAIERCDLLEEHAAAKAAIESETLKSAIVSSLSHDLRTPISAIATSAGTLHRYGGGMSDDERNEMFETIQEQCARLDAFTGKMLSLGRIEAGLPSSRFELVDVEEVLGSAIASMRIAFPQRQILRHIDEGLAFTMATPVLLEQVLVNVLENALRYSDAQSSIAIALTGDPERIMVSVTDRGCGIAPEDLPHIFERFYRGSRGATPGHGLGLAITKSFLDAIGGSVEITSPVADGHGTQVRIRFPRSAEKVNEPHE